MQLTLNLSNHNSFLPEDLIISDANKYSCDFLGSWPNWGEGNYSRLIYLQGDKHSGKTHICHWWQKISGAHFIRNMNLKENSSSYIIDDIDKYLGYENDIFHFINEVILQKKFLLISSSLLPEELKVKKPDLSSRFKSFQLLKIAPPDDLLIRGLIMSYFSQRQIKISEDIIAYLEKRLERSYSFIHNILNKINELATVRKRKVTIPLISSILE